MKEEDLLIGWDFNKDFTDKILDYQMRILSVKNNELAFQAVISSLILKKELILKHDYNIKMKEVHPSIFYQEGLILCLDVNLSYLKVINGLRLFCFEYVKDILYEIIEDIGIPEKQVLQDLDTIITLAEEHN